MSRRLRFTAAALGMLVGTPMMLSSAAGAGTFMHQYNFGHQTPESGSQPSRRSGGGTFQQRQATSPTVAPSFGAVGVPGTAAGPRTGSDRIDLSVCDDPGGLPTCRDAIKGD